MTPIIETPILGTGISAGAAASGIYPHYSFLTQGIANEFPSWTKIRKSADSSGQQFLNVFGMQLDNIHRANALIENNLYLESADINVADVIYKAELPRHIELDENNPPLVSGDSLRIELLDDLNIFFYLMPPTRLEAIETETSLPSGTSFSDSLAYDIPYINSYKEEESLYFQCDADSSGNAQLSKYFLIDEGTEIPLEVATNKEILGQYHLVDSDGSAITGTYHGACLGEDTLVAAFGSGIYVFDTRIPLLANTDLLWAGNKESDTVVALKRFYPNQSLTSIVSLSTDEDRQFFWTYDGTTYTKYRFSYDYGIFDYDRRTLYCREEYASLLVDGTSYIQTAFNVPNHFDQFGFLLDTPRLLEESNQEYKIRLQQVFQFRANSTIQGVVNGTSRELDLTPHGYFPVDEYPENLFLNGVFITGYPIYVNGAYPSDVTDLAKINVLYEPAFYSGHVNVVDNTPDTEFVDYTKEILETAPILWGSGETDKIGFIWDISAFDGGLNSTDKVPDFMGNMASGISSEYYQSGVRDPDSDDLRVRMVLESGEVWKAQVHTGDFFVHDKMYYNFSELVEAAIPPESLTFTFPSDVRAEGTPIFVIDISGHTAPSGYQYTRVDTLGSTSHEFSVSGSLLTIGEAHNGLSVYYDASPSGWNTLPWDFNPLHGIGYDGFIWVGDQAQRFDPDASFTLTANPEELGYAAGGSIIIGGLHDLDDEPIIGALTHFRLSNSAGILSHNEAYTQFDGKAISFLTIPGSIENVQASGIVVDRNYDWVLSVDQPFNLVSSFVDRHPISIVLGNLVAFSMNNTMWVIQANGGWGGSSVPTIAYSSANGSDWTPINLLASYPTLYTIASSSTLCNFVHLGDYLLTVINGNQIWRSSDGTTWTQISTAPWTTNRTRGKLVVHQDKIFFMGGMTGSSFPQTIYASNDGVAWETVTSSAAWPGRSKPYLVSYDNKLWLWGGRTTSWALLNDGMWVSDDNGITWTNICSLPFDPNSDGEAIVYNNLMWVTGGLKNTAGTISTNETWYSSNGTTWTLLTSCPWAHRADHSLIVHNDRLFLVGGVNTWGPSVFAVTTNNVFELTESLKILFDKSIPNQSLDEIYTTAQKPDISGYPEEQRIVLMTNGDSYDINITPGDWLTTDLPDGYSGKYIIGGSSLSNTLNGVEIGDSFFNIDLGSIHVNNGMIYEVDSLESAGSQFKYEVDDYASPQEYGKIIVYCVTIPIGNTSITFDTYKPAFPIISEITPSGSWLTYPTITNRTTNSTYHASYPLDIDITGWAEYNGLETLHKTVSVRVRLTDAQKGVFRLDQKFADYFAYLRMS
jgi:hypothetical protein